MGLHCIEHPEQVFASQLPLIQLENAGPSHTGWAFLFMATRSLFFFAALIGPPLALNIYHEITTFVEVKTSQSWATIFSDSDIVVGLTLAAFAVLVVHIVAAYSVHLLSRQTTDRKKAIKKNIYITLAVYIVVLGWNYREYPQSLASIYMEPIFSQDAWLGLFVAAHLYVSMICLSAFAQTATRIKLTALIFLAIYWISVAFEPILRPINVDITRNKPDIILIGVDSLRPDFLEDLVELSGEEGSSIGDLLAKMTIFSDAVTPLANTYPAWMSVLTGLMPRAHGAVANLVAPDFVATSRTLGWNFLDEGYVTVYASDERRFANINENHGFGKIIGPKTGLLDFLIGEKLDLPLVNLALKSDLSESLFPYKYINRAASKTYDPYRFDRVLSETISSLPQEAPLFAAFHYCLPHWPYVWDKATKRPTAEFVKHEDRSPVVANYRRSLLGVDRQVRNLLSTLEKNNRINNAIVVFFSDHGEGLNIARDDFAHVAPEWGRKVSFGRNPAGHGSDVMSPAHQRVVLAFRDFRTSRYKALSTVPASLIDIAPTLRDLVGAPWAPSDGMSLVQALESVGPTDHYQGRIRIWESSFRPLSLLHAELNEEEITREGARYYELGSKGRLVIRGPIMKELITKKQFAAKKNDIIIVASKEQGGWVLAQADWKSMSWSPLDSNITLEQEELLKALCEYIVEYNIEAPMCSVS